MIASLYQSGSPPRVIIRLRRETLPLRPFALGCDFAKSGFDSGTAGPVSVCEGIENDASLQLGGPPMPARHLGRLARNTNGALELKGASVLIPQEREAGLWGETRYRSAQFTAGEQQARLQRCRSPDAR